ncbi:hypothetical protein Tco_0052838 [Tanacetum coccineum]
MRTRSQSRNSNRQQQQVPPTFVEPFNLVEPIENQAPPVVTMDDNRILWLNLLRSTHCGFTRIPIGEQIQVRNSRNKLVVTKVSSSSSTPGISPNVAELKDMVKALLLDKKSQAPAPVKAVEKVVLLVVVFILTELIPAQRIGNVYRDNIQEYVSQVAAANFNQGNTVTTG